VALSAEWAREQFSVLSERSQADVRAVLAVLKTKGGPAATKKLLALEKKREWPRWVMYALRDIIGTAWEHRIDL
jgi:hypothetical protein